METSKLASRVLPRFVAGGTPNNGPLEGFDVFDDTAPSEVSSFNQEGVVRHVGENPAMLDAMGLIKSPGLQDLVAPVAVFLFRRKRAWMVLADADNESGAVKAGKRAQANLVARKSLSASDTYLDVLGLYVVYRGGYVRLCNV